MNPAKIFLVITTGWFCVMALHIMLYVARSVDWWMIGIPLIFTLIAYWRARNATLFKGSMILACILSPFTYQFFLSLIFGRDKILSIAQIGAPFWIGQLIILIVLIVILFSHSVALKKVISYALLYVLSIVFTILMPFTYTMATAGFYYALTGGNP